MEVMVMLFLVEALFGLHKKFISNKTLDNL